MTAIDTTNMNTTEIKALFETGKRYRISIVESKTQPVGIAICLNVVSGKTTKVQVRSSQVWDLIALAPVEGLAAVSFKSANAHSHNCIYTFHASNFASVEEISN